MDSKTILSVTGVVLIALGGGIPAIAGTGAVETAGDQFDLNQQNGGVVGADVIEYTDDDGVERQLLLRPHPGPNGDFAALVGPAGEETLEIAVAETESGSGVNPRALSTVDNVFVVENPEETPVDVGIVPLDTDGAVIDTDEIVFYDSADRSSIQCPGIDEGSCENAAELNGGEQVAVGFSADASDPRSIERLAAIDFAVSASDDDEVGAETSSAEAESTAKSPPLSPTDDGAGSNDGSETPDGDERTSAETGSTTSGGGTGDGTSEGEADGENSPTPAPTETSGSDEGEAAQTELAGFGFGGTSLWIGVLSLLIGAVVLIAARRLPS